MIVLFYYVCMYDDLSMLQWMYSEINDIDILSRDDLAFSMPVVPVI